VFFTKSREQQIQDLMKIGFDVTRIGEKPLDNDERLMRRAVQEPLVLVLLSALGATPMYLQHRPFWSIIRMRSRHFDLDFRARSSDHVFIIGK
jgi:hypothetical protein